jgi:competence protein ComEA
VELENQSEETVAGESTKNELMDKPAEFIYVHVCGAVKTPGVVKLPMDSRVDDALRAAGGFAENACTEYVNLAARISDGEQLYFPDAEEAEHWTRAAEAFQSGIVNINTAGKDTLMTLPGIGEVRAKDIISYREENGPFGTIEEIQNVSGIKGSVFEKLRDKITVE